MGKVSLSGLDFSGERSRFAANMVDLTAGNIAAQLALVANLVSATNDISYIPFGHTVLAEDVPSVGQATDANGQRELKARVRYADDVTGARFSVEVPAPILTGNLIAGSDFFDLTATDIAAFVAAFEAVVMSPDDLANSVTIVNMQVVGRSL
jgi:hypothetical protein